MTLQYTKQLILYITTEWSNRSRSRSYMFETIVLSHWLTTIRVLTNLKFSLVFIISCWVRVHGMGKSCEQRQHLKEAQSVIVAYDTTAGATNYSKNVVVLAFLSLVSSIFWVICCRHLYKILCHFIFIVLQEFKFNASYIRSVHSIEIEKIWWCVDHPACHVPLRHLQHPAPRFDLPPSLTSSSATR